MKKAILLLSATAILFGACKKHDPELGGVFKGTEVTFQHGKAWTWVSLKDNGTIDKMAITIDDAAMNSLDTTRPGSGGHHHENDIMVPMPVNAGNTPFNHVFLGWNPYGHEPGAIYGKAHFDFHFYTTTSAEREAIPPYETDSVKYKNWPAAGYFPANYINGGGGVPKMGAHWVDITSPELNGGQFGETFFYGSYDGKVTFIEPMITEAFIKANPGFSRSIPQPQKFQLTGWYPTRMSIARHDGVTEVVLSNFEYHIRS